MKQSIMTNINDARTKHLVYLKSRLRNNSYNIDTSQSTNQRIFEEKVFTRYRIYNKCTCGPNNTPEIIKQINQAKSNGFFGVWFVGNLSTEQVAHIGSTNIKTLTETPTITTHLYFQTLSGDIFIDEHRTIELYRLQQLQFKFIRSLLKVGYAISTFNRDNPQRQNIFMNSIRTFVENTPLCSNDVVYMVDDCSPIKTHLTHVRSKYPHIKIHEKETNGGISKVKNTSIRLLQDEGCDIMFLLDDDNMYINKNWSIEYIKRLVLIDNNFVQKTFSMKSATMFNFNNVPCIWSNSIYGTLLGITKYVIDEIGYFKVFPSAYAGDHHNFTFRILEKHLCKGLIDVPISDVYVVMEGRMPYANAYKIFNGFTSSMSTIEKNESRATNIPLMYDLTNQPLIE